MRKCILLLLGLVVVCLALTNTGYSATEQQKMDAINKGLAYLAATQQPNGSWSYYYGIGDQAATGAAVLAFLSQKNNWGDNEAAYQAVVDNAVAYLLASGTLITVSTRADGVNICPGGIGNCPGVYWYGGGETTYTTGLVIPALVTYGLAHPNDVATGAGPLAGMTWLQIAQAVTNMFSAGQSVSGFQNGGWRYFPGTGDSDGSTTQWAVLSLIYDQQIGAVTPQTVKDRLKIWLGIIQGPDGSGCYQPNVYCDHSDTGSLLLGLKFVGNDLSNAQIIKAISFLNNNWTAGPSNTWFGNFGHSYAMWAVYKGLEVNIGLDDNTHIMNLLSNCGAPDNLPGNPAGSKPCNWYEDYNHWLVANQLADGSWAGYGYWEGALATSWYINILGATKVPIGNPVLDDFNRPNGNVGLNWSGSRGQYMVESNQVEPDGQYPVYWNKSKFGVDQEAFVTLTKIDPLGVENDLLLKVQGIGPNGINYLKGYIEVWYSPRTKKVTVTTRRPNTSNWTVYLPKLSATFSDGDKFGARALSTGEVQILQNDSVIGTVTLNNADQTFFNTKGGYIGLWFVDSKNGYFDDFGGGDL